MNCNAFDNRLDDFLDGELSLAEARALRDHAAECSRCARMLATGRRLGTEALALADVREPPRDLWPGIAARLQPRAARRPDRRQPWFRAVAAGALVAAVFFGGMFTDRLVRDEGNVEPRMAARSPRTVTHELPGVDEARRLLPASYVELVEGGADLEQDTERTLLRNLMLVNLAIRDVEEAAAEDPANKDLRQLLAGLYAQENRILSQAERLRVAQSTTTRTGI